MKNPINKILLWLFLLPTGIYQKLGAHIPHLRTILRYKLIMDDRGATGMYKLRKRNPEKEINTATLLTMFLSLVMGSFLLMIFFLKDDLTRMTFYFSAFSFTLGLFLITDFSEILLDPKDNYILLPKPISARTFTVARLLHILIHITKIAVPLMIPGIIAIAISRGITGEIGYLVCAILLTLFTFVLVNAGYLLMIRIFSPRKLNSIIATVQIVFTILLYASYQILPRLMDQEDIENIVLKPIAWLWLFPVYWFGKAWVFLYSFSFEPDLIIGLLLILILPVVGIWVMIRYLAPAFFRKLSLIQADVSIEKKTEKQTQLSTSSSKGLTKKMAAFLTKKGLEQQSFLFTWNMMARSREFKMKVYPQIGYWIVLLVLMTFRSWKAILLQGVDETFLENDKLIIIILSLIYFTSFIFMGGVLQIPYTENFKAAWIYFISPLNEPGLIMRGSIKALLLKFFIPLVAILSMAGVIFLGPGIIPNLFFGFSNVFLTCVILSWLAMDRFPFSIPLKNQARGSVTARNFFILFAVGFFGIPHYFLFRHPIIMSCLAVITLSIAWFFLYYTRTISWKNIKEA